jgi:GMC oxidoreductase
VLWWRRERASLTPFAGGDLAEGKSFRQHWSVHGTASKRIDRNNRTEETAFKLQRLYNNFHRPRGSRAKEPQYEIGFALTERAQQEHKILNASAALYYDVGDDTSWKAARRLREAWNGRATDSAPLRDIGKLFAGMAEVIPNAIRRYLMGREVVHKNPTISIVADFEQEPDCESRLMLSSDIDALGMRRVIVDWRISELERQTARHLCRFIASALHKLDLGRVRGVDWLDNDAPIGLRETHHAIGTTRMSEAPENGVVNPDCRVHGIENLYVAGCSVFPTGGHANPTLTIIALAVRLADHLRSIGGVQVGRLLELDLARKKHSWRRHVCS